MPRRKNLLVVPAVTGCLGKFDAKLGQHRPSSQGAGAFGQNCHGPARWVDRTSRTESVTIPAGSQKCIKMLYNIAALQERTRRSRRRPGARADERNLTAGVVGVGRSISGSLLAKGAVIEIGHSGAPTESAVVERAGVCGSYPYKRFFRNSRVRPQASFEAAAL